MEMVEGEAKALIRRLQRYGYFYLIAKFSREFWSLLVVNGWRARSKPLNSLENFVTIKKIPCFDVRGKDWLAWLRSWVMFIAPSTT